jgi:hypothetical protein
MSQVEPMSCRAAITVLKPVGGGDILYILGAAIVFDLITFLIFASHPDIFLLREYSLGVHVGVYSFAFFGLIATIYASMLIVRWYRGRGVYTHMVGVPVRLGGVCKGEVFLPYDLPAEMDVVLKIICERVCVTNRTDVHGRKELADIEPLVEWESRVVKKVKDLDVSQSWRIFHFCVNVPPVLGDDNQLQCRSNGGEHQWSVRLSGGRLWGALNIEMPFSVSEK